MKKLVPCSTVALAGLVAAGLLVYPSAVSAGAAGDQAYVKREHDAGQLVLVADDEDDGDDTGADNATRTRTRSRASRATRHSGHGAVTRGHTRSNATAISRDRDHSRGDKVRDHTRDGGTHTRDLTPNLTDDGSRHDTRG